MNKQRVTRVSIAMILVYIAGYFNAELSILFLNKDSLIGLLFSVAVIAFSYTIYLDRKILRLKINADHDSNKIYNLTENARNHKLVKDQFKELKLILEKNPRIDELKNSLVLRDACIKELENKNDLLQVNIELKDLKIKELTKQH